VELDFEIIESANGFLNQDCILMQDFESIFPGAPFKTVFQQYRPMADIAPFEAAI
jgi:hypothetical protein